MFRITYKKTIEKTNNITYQAMESFIHSLNTICSKEGNLISPSSISFGTDTSPEGRMVIKNFLEAMQSGLGNYETPEFPVPIFKVKNGINLNKKDKNYDLFELACDICSKMSMPNFAFLDAQFNKEYYRDGDYDTEAGYMGCNVRILENYVDENKATVAGRGNLSITSINLPRMGIKYGVISNEKANLNNFFEELEEKLDLVKDQLLERFELQCKKKKDNFPFLLGQELWIDSEKIKDTDNLKKVLKQGTLSIGFIGLAECLKALIGQHQGESKEAQKLGLKIVDFMRKKCDEYSEKYNLNFNLVATTANSSLNKFIKLDQAIYGKLKGITDKENYTQGFEIPNNCKVKIEEKINIEAPYHMLTNGGHITHIKLDKENMKNAKYVAEIVKQMQEKQIGYAKIEVLK